MNKFQGTTFCTLAPNILGSQHGTYCILPSWNFEMDPGFWDNCAPLIPSIELLPSASKCSIFKPSRHRQNDPYVLTASKNTHDLKTTHMCSAVTEWWKQLKVLIVVTKTEKQTRVLNSRCDGFYLHLDHC